MGKVEELREQIAILEERDVPESLIQEKRDELAKLTGTATAETTKPKKGERVTEERENYFELDITPDELNNIPDGLPKRPPAGLYEAEWLKPDRNYSSKAAKMPFILTEPGHFKNCEDAFYPARSAPFSIKNLATATGVKAQENTKTGKARYNLDDFMGKRFKVLYVEEEGEIDGRKFVTTKAKKALPLDTVNLGIGDERELPF